MDGVRRREPWGFLVVLTRAAKLVLLCSALAFGIGAILPEQRADEALRAEVEQVKAERDVLRDMASKERKTTERLRYDQEYLEIVARDRLDYCAPGETILRFKENGELN
mgnify:CR=1 FL=1